MTKDTHKKLMIASLKFDTTDAEVDAGVAIPNTIQLIPIGQWDHDMYGPIMITNADIREFIQNFNQQIRKGVFITAGHEGFQELPAVGWVSKVEARDDGLWGDVEWNELGRDTLGDKQYKFFSPEFYRDYEDPQSHQIYRNVLTGGALTKSPYFKELEAIVFSDKSIIKNKFNDTNTMNIKDILAKDITTLSEEEKAFLIAHKEELTDEEKTAVTSIIDVEETKAETEEEKTAREEKEAGDANEAAGLNRDGSAKEELDADGKPIAASEKKMVSISASELAILKTKADQGHQAYTELEAKKLGESVAKMIYTEANKDGKFLPKSEAVLKTFMATLNAKQKESFAAIMKELPKANLFGEMGVDAGKTVTAVAGKEAFAAIESLVEAKMKVNPKLKYSEALKEVYSEKPELHNAYVAENGGKIVE